MVKPILHSYKDGKCIVCEPPTNVGEVVIKGVGAEVIYDLQGRRVTSPVKNGIYIVNGKRRVVTN